MSNTYCCQSTKILANANKSYIFTLLTLYVLVNGPIMTFEPVDPDTSRFKGENSVKEKLLNQ
jgi:hypothetical protein